MKIKKLLPLVLLAVGALFLLSSCDALLDAIYPNNNLTVNVAVVQSTHTDWALSGSYIYVLVYDSAGNAATLSSGISSYDLANAYGSVSFPKLKNDTYTIYAYYHGAYGFNYAARILFSKLRSDIQRLFRQCHG